MLKTTSGTTALATARRFCLGFTCCLLLNSGSSAQAQQGTPAPSDTEPAATGQQPQQRAVGNKLSGETIASELRKQQHRLSAGGQLFSAYYIDQVALEARGAVLLIPDLQHGPTSTSIVNSLRNALPQSHYSTVTLDLRPIDRRDPQQMFEALTAGIEFLAKQDVLNITLIAEGAGGAQAIDYLAKLSRDGGAALQNLRALILINARHSPTDSELDTLAAITDIELSLLDAVSNNDFILKDLAQLRRKASQSTESESNYHQLALPRIVNYTRRHDNSVTKRIRGWMDKNISDAAVEQR